ncbi:hypothetical protein PIB30_068942 [Stylosanthes scabra]|uniref:Uncharacterized protein n=1 Tax=Stylosanthes scabra TaxID=79078 RepID=A0ABU6XNX0_9FABA|nr:hypothetical protein [Stylosanthes scabra]
MLQRITSQPNQTQPPSPILLLSQPLPNPKRGINVIQSKEAEGEEDEDENKEGNVSWWYNLLAQLVDFDDEESEDESEEEDEDGSAEEDSEDKSAEEEDQTEEEESEDEEEVYNKRTSFIATIFNNKEIKEEVPIKCEDPGPCLVT